MSKEMKSSPEVGNLERESFIGQVVEQIMEQGDQLGNEIIERMNLKEIDPVSIGTATIGLAKALAMLKDVARRTGFNISKLHQQELVYFKRVFERGDFEVEEVN